MTVTIQPGANVYSQGFGSVPQTLSVYVPHFDVRVPTSTDINYPVGKVWIYAGNSIWQLLSLSTAAAVMTASWVELASTTGNVLSVTGTANQITASTSSGAVTLSIPSTFIAPGSIASTTTMTAGTGLTVTTGNATLSGTGSGLVLTPVVVAAGASPQTANGRVFSVTFSGVSIAAGATQSLVIANTSVNTLVQLSMVGATAGSALTIQSITNSAGVSTTIVVTNGTGATTNTANLTFTGLCIN